MVCSANSDDLLTLHLKAWREGDGAALQALLHGAYAKLRELAEARLQQAAQATLTPTELLNESLLRVIQGGITWQNRAHFFASMSLYLRGVLLDHLRAKRSEKRGGGATPLTLDAVLDGEMSPMVDLLALDQALQELETHDRRSSTVLHLSIFGGLGRQDIAEVLKLSTQTVDRDLRFARAWVARAMREEA